MTTAHVEHRRKLFDEECRLTAALSAVRTRLNELTAVGTLPTEVLEVIFEFCISWLYGRHKPKYRLAWAQVCRRWRSISLNSPHLWHCIDLSNSRLANEFLIRSKATPISIVSALPLKSCMDNSCIDNLGSHAERLQTIDVYLFPNCMAELFSRIGSQLSNVTTLSLIVPPMSIALALDIQMPQVTRLDLNCVTVPWGACRSLTHLSLRGLSADYSPTITQLHSILESSLNLQYLRLENIVPTLCPNDDIVPTRIAPLPNLHRLIITTNADIILALLSKIAFPSTTRVQLACPEFNDVHSLFPRDRSWKAANVGTICLDQRSITFLRHGALSWMEKSSDHLFSVTSLWSLGKATLPNAHLIVDLSGITTLEIGMEALVHLPPELLSNFLTATVNLKSLHISHNDLGDLLRILTPIQTTLVPCPRLECIAFSMNYPAAVQWWDFNKRWMQPVLALTKARHEHGVPLATLEFRRCRGVTAQQFEGLAQEIRVLDC
jgi:F-box-like